MTGQVGTEPGFNARGNLQRQSRRHSRASAGKAEPVVDLKDVRTTGFYGLSLSLGPDDQPIVTRDNG
jgi:hypothetical protein